MKKQIVKFLLIFSILFGASHITQAQVRVYVKVRPTAVVTTRTVAPHAGWVWVDDEWTIKDGAYVQVPGHWIAPRRGWVWVPGHWSTEARGDYWVAGHWKRV